MLLELLGYCMDGLRKQLECRVIQRTRAGPGCVNPATEVSKTLSKGRKQDKFTGHTFPQ